MNCLFQNSGKNILVTGISGFIGGHLVKRLGKIHNIFGVVLPSEKVDGCAGLLSLDLKDKALAVTAAKELNHKHKIDIIIHMASEMVGAENASDQAVLVNNVKMAESVAEIAKAVRPSKVINFSSMAVYPNMDGVYNEESKILTSPNSDCLYGLSKFCSENIIDFLLGREKIAVSHLRISNVYGEGMRGDRIMPAMRKELEEKGTVTVFGNGERTSAFIGVEKLVEQLSVFIEKDLSGIFNVSEENLSFVELAERVVKQSNRKDARIIRVQKGSTVQFSLDTSKIDHILAGAKEDIKTESRVFVIAEAGVNHNGSIEMAMRMVDVAAEAGADAIKFQTYKAEKVMTGWAPKAAYQKETTDRTESQLEMVRRYELDRVAHEKIAAYCKKKNIMFLSTPHDLDSVDLLAELGLEIFKVPSGEVTDLPYLRKIGGLGKKVILSTGMADMAEIRRAFNVLVKAGTRKDDITVLQCTTNYPAKFSDANLLAMCAIRDALKVKVGYSDHTVGIEASIAAVAMGATVIEKHFTLDKGMEGPDHKASVDPSELKALVSAVRNVEKALGRPEKSISDSEKDNIKIVRKSIVASTEIKKGEEFTEQNITVKRPATGISPMEWDMVVGKTAVRDFAKDELIEL